MKKDAFFELIAEPAKKVMKDTGFLASVIIAQAATQSEWFESKLYKDAINPFGEEGEYNGESYELPFKSDGDEKVSGVIKFKKYPDLTTAIVDHVDTLYNAKNGDVYCYRDAFGESDPKVVVTILRDGGYTLASNYVSKIMKIINSNGLTRYDNEVIEELKKEAAEKPVNDHIIEVADKTTDEPNVPVKDTEVEVVDKVETPVSNISVVSLVAGTKLDIVEAKIYTNSSPDSKIPPRVVKNMALYVFDGKKFGNRYRVCRSKASCNTTVSNVFGYIDLNDMKLR